MPNDPYHRRVKDVMSRDVVSVHPRDSIHEALALMAENRVAALPVTDSHRRCAGMISTSDVIDLTHELDEELTGLGRVDGRVQQWFVEKLSAGLEDHEVGQLMTQNVASVGPETLLTQAAHEMRRHRVHRLPVLDSQQRLLGIVSTMDILDAFVEGSNGLAPDQGKEQAS